MKILFTGVTSLQVAKTNKSRTIQKIDVPESVVNTLTMLGHEVHWRPTKVGEDLSGYDLIWTNYAGIMSFQAPYALGALWSIHEAWRLHRPHVLFFDDWQVRVTLSHARSFANLANKQLNKTIQGNHIYHDWEAGLQYEAEFISVARRVGNMAYEDTAPGSVALCPMYAWGRHDFVRRKLLAGVHEMAFAFIDPTPTIFLAKDLIRNNKSDAHALAALMPHDKWVNEKLRPTWPVNYYGSRKLKAPRLKTERDVQQAYANHWGILSPPYPQAGSGWWRSRFLYGAHVGSVVICDPAECAPLPGYHVSVGELETASDVQRFEMWQRQRDAFLPRCWSVKDWVGGVANVLEKASWLVYPPVAGGAAS